MGDSSECSDWEWAERQYHDCVGDKICVYAAPALIGARRAARDGSLGVVAAPPIHLLRVVSRWNWACDCQLIALSVVLHRIAFARVGAAHSLVLRLLRA